MRTIIFYILLITASFNPVFAANDSLINVLGPRKIVDVKKRSLRWLKTEVFMGMQVHGDTLILSSSVDPEIEKADKEAGEENMIRSKFKESRMVYVSRYEDRRRFKVQPFEGDANQQKHNGGLAFFEDGKSGLLPEFNRLRTKSKLFYVKVDDGYVKKEEEWEGNIIGDYVAFPTFSNKYRETIFMTKNGDYDLYLWDNEKNRVSAFRHNTDADEMYPTIFNDSILFFSSDRLEKGNYDIFYYNMNTDNPPELYLPNEIQSGRNELGISFLNDSTFLLASRKGKGLVSFDKFMLELEPVPEGAFEDEIYEALDPNDKLTIQLREQGRIALTMFQEKYGVSIPVKHQENIFRDSTRVSREILKAVQHVLSAENAVDVSFLLPVHILDTAYYVEGYDPDMYLVEGLRKIGELCERIPGTSIMAIGFANATGGSDLNLMRSYYQASSYEMQFTDFSGIDSNKVHILAAGDYIENNISIRRKTEKEKRGAIYLFKNVKAPPKVVAYQLKPGETKERIAQRMGLSSFEFTYYNVLLTPFITPPDNIMFIPVREIEMIWQGHDLRETARKYNVSLKQLLQVNNMSDYINESKRVIYIP